MSREITIDHNVKIPESRRNHKYPWREMKKGDSFFTEAPYMQGPMMTAARRIGNGCKFICRSITENGVKGTRVWRVS